MTQQAAVTSHLPYGVATHPPWQVDSDVVVRALIRQDGQTAAAKAPGAGAPLDRMREDHRRAGITAFDDAAGLPGFPLLHGDRKVHR
jgi:hypothetical protein